MAVLPVLSTLLSLLSAVAFALVGHKIQARDMPSQLRVGRNAFVLWWYGLAVVTVLGATTLLPAFQSLNVFLALTMLILLILSASLCGLLFYLVFVFTERRSLLVPMAVAYAGFFVFLAWFILAGHPTGIETTKWGSQTVYENPIDSGPAYWAAILLLIGPQIVGALGYLSLYWTADDPLRKKRILLVSLSILTWFGTSLIGTGVGAENSDWWQITSRLIGLAAAGTIYYAYTAIQPEKPHASEDAPSPGSESVYEQPPRNQVVGVTRMSA